GLRSGSITHEIIGAAKARGADLIVMTSRRPEMRDYPIGANAAQVVRHAPCSVLVLR
ncbi:MAG: universal stress protein, partial [Alphaproteobacteria bacterium]|nr:universal stress protein [Alphaproteobacteria bacterium]